MPLAFIATDLTLFPAFRDGNPQQGLVYQLERTLAQPWQEGCWVVLSQRGTLPVLFYPTWEVLSWTLGGAFCSPSQGGRVEVLLVLQMPWSSSLHWWHLRASRVEHGEPTVQFLLYCALDLEFHQSNCPLSVGSVTCHVYAGKNLWSACGPCCLHESNPEWKQLSPFHLECEGMDHLTFEKS